MCKRIVKMLFSLAIMALCGCIQVGVIPSGELETVVIERSPRWFEFYRVALVDVDGFIGLSDGFSFLWSGTTVADIKEKLNRAASDSRVRAVILRINSPGGEVTASDMIHHEVLNFRNSTGKPVVALLMGTATSGSYYIAAGADRIIAAPTCVTGSVGVIMRYTNIEGLYGKIGLREEVIKSGEKKDIGSAVRPLTPEERDILQQINRTLFESFLQVVRTGRPKMTDADLRMISDGRVLTADQALALNMVDRIGYADDAVTEAERLAGIGGADVVLYRAYPNVNANVYAHATPRPSFMEQGLELLLRRRGAVFLYLWSPDS